MQADLAREQRQKAYAQRKAEREAWKATHTSSEACPECGSVLYIREGKYGEFLGCSNYPNCTFAKKLKK